MLNIAETGKRSCLNVECHILEELLFTLSNSLLIQKKILLCINAIFNINVGA